MFSRISTWISSNSLETSHHNLGNCASLVLNQFITASLNNHLSYVARLNSISQTAGHGEVAHETAEVRDEGGGGGDEEVGGRGLWGAVLRFVGPLQGKLPLVSLTCAAQQKHNKPHWQWTCTAQHRVNKETAQKNNVLILCKTAQWSEYKSSRRLNPTWHVDSRW